MSARKPEVFEESLSIPNTFARIQLHETKNDYRWLSGDVVTRRGLVSVYSDDSVSRYDFVSDGRLHIRTEERSRTQRGLAIEAAKFARRIASSRTGGQRT